MKSDMEMGMLGKLPDSSNRYSLGSTPRLVGLFVSRIRIMCDVNMSDCQEDSTVSYVIRDR